MKRLTAVVLCSVLLLFALFPSVSAYTEAADTGREYFEDGSYITVSLESDIHPESGELTSFLSRLIELLRRIIEFFKSEKSVKETKYAAYYDSNGKCLWKVYLEGEFTYNGKTSECKEVKTYCDIYDSDWKLISESSSTDGNRATGSFTLKQYKLGVPLKEIEKTLALVCDKDGNIQ